LVLDEADEMLNMGFKEDIDLILSETPSTKNTWLFSATMPNEIQKIAKTYMHEPKEVQIGNRNQGNDNIDHVYYTVNSGDRYAALKRVVDASPDIFGIVFCRTKIETQDISDSLIKDGYNADALHGDLSQAQRDHVMKRYRSRTLQLLVCTDVAARGIDVTDVTHVINYNLPDEIEYYTHRSGRTARAGKKGISIAIITTREVGKIRDIERKIKKTFTQGVLPTGIEVCEKQLINLVKNVHDVKVNEEAIAAYLPTVHDELKELDREEIIKRFISIEFNRFLDYYKNAPDLNSKGRSAGGSFPGDATKLFINIGSMDGFDPLTLKDYLREVTGFTKQEITYVASKNAYSFVEVAQAKVEEFIKIMSKQKNNGRQVRVEFRGDQQPNSRPPRRSYDDKPQRHYSDSNSGGGGGGSRPSEGGNRTFRKRSPMKAR
ncbi:MAG: DEAD/DEAH box helicase, partial [Bacteroidetes bacterium]|nr:DEAD/DEAH box helicase [Bacteroidota bacterium]